jgi:hypothetical protein
MKDEIRMKNWFIHEDFKNELAWVVKTIEEKRIQVKELNLPMQFFGYIPMELKMWNMIIKLEDRHGDDIIRYKGFKNADENNCIEGEIRLKDINEEYANAWEDDLKHTEYIFKNVEYRERGPIPDYTFYEEYGEEGIIKWAKALKEFDKDIKGIYVNVHDIIGARRQVVPEVYDKKDLLEVHEKGLLGTLWGKDILIDSDITKKYDLNKDRIATLMIDGTIKVFDLI